MLASARFVRVALLAGVLAPIAAWTLSTIVIATWPGYDPIRQSIGLLADAPLGWLQTFAFAISGALGLAWALALPHVRGASPRDRAAVRALLLLQALIALGFAALATDPEGAPTTTIGRLHLADFYAYALTMPITLLVITLVIRRDPRWHGSERPTLLAASLAVVSILLVPATLEGPLTPWLGLLERLYVAIPSIWQLGISLAALRHLGAAEPAAAAEPTAPATTPPSAMRP